jgi:hypothetical protein
MSDTEFLEVGKVVGSILAVWFALLGWKLFPRTEHRAYPPRLS